MTPRNDSLFQAPRYSSQETKTTAWEKREGAWTEARRGKTHFIYHFIVDSFLTGTLEPTDDQLPTSVAS